MEQISLTGKKKRVLRYRKDRDVSEHRIYHELVDRKGNPVWIRNDVASRQSILEFNFYRCDYLPYNLHFRGTRFYRTWSNMKQRCLNKTNRAYEWYGGKGIKICPDWLHFSCFYDDMFSEYEDHLEIDRIDNSKGYSRENCRWVTNEQQANNTSRNRNITINGVTKNICQWGKENGIKPNTITTRIVKYGWTEERAVSTPVT